MQLIVLIYIVLTHCFLILSIYYRMLSPTNGLNENLDSISFGSRKWKMLTLTLCRSFWKAFLVKEKLLDQMRYLSTHLAKEYHPIVAGNTFLLFNRTGGSSAISYSSNCSFATGWLALSSINGIRQSCQHDDFVRGMQIHRWLPPFWPLIDSAKEHWF